MATAEERRKILEMVAEGRLSASQGAQLLQGDVDVAESVPQSEETASQPEPVEEPAPAPEAIKEEAPSEMQWESEDNLNWLHIRIDDNKSGRSKVQVNIPLGLLKFGAKVGRGVMPELSKADWQLLRSSLQSGDGVLVDIDNEHQGERVQVYLG